MRKTRLLLPAFGFLILGIAALRLQSLWMAPTPARVGQTPAGLPKVTARQRLDVYGKLPLSFEANQGQAAPRVDFLSRGLGYTLFLTANEVDVSLGSAGTAPHQAPTALRMKLMNANPRAGKAGLEELPGKVNYLLGRDSAAWHAGIATYAKVRYQEVYPGVDVVYYGHQRQLEYDFVVAPGADPRTIALALEGADRLDFDARGDLVLAAAGGPILQMRKPVIYQEVKGARREISGGYVLAGNDRVGFQIGAYDTARPLVIDPVFVYSTHFGGGNDEAAGYGIAVDAAGNAYVTGDASSTNFPLAKPLQRAVRGSTDVFVAKLSADGSRLLYSTYLGGGSGDSGYAIAVDAAGSAYVTGDTSSTDFPLVKPLQSALGGAADVFVAKLSADGSKLLYSTYIGGSGGDRGQGIGVDSSGDAWVAGYTHSTNFPTVNPLQGSFAGGNADAFVLKLNPGGSGLLFSTYLGGGNDRPDIATAIAVDGAGNAYVTGFTNSVDFPTVKPGVQPFRGPTDVFVTKINPSGSALIYSTYLGGIADDEAMGIAVDAAGSAYVTGHTESTDYPTTPGAFSTQCVAVPVTIPAVGNKICSGGDAFISKLSPDGSRLIYSTYLNGHGFEVGRGIAVDAAGDAFVTGLTSSPDLPTANPVQKTFGGGDFDAFVIELNPEGSALIYSTYLGGGDVDGGYALALDAAGNAYVTGFTSSPDFPTRKPLRRAASGAKDVFVTKIAGKAPGGKAPGKTHGKAARR